MSVCFHQAFSCPLNLLDSGDEPVTKVSYCIKPFCEHVYFKHPEIVILLYTCMGTKCFVPMHAHGQEQRLYSISIQVQVYTIQDTSCTYASAISTCGIQLSLLSFLDTL